MFGEIRATAERYFAQITQLLATIDLDALQRVVDILRDARAEMLPCSSSAMEAAPQPVRISPMTSSTPPGFRPGLPLRAFSLVDNGACVSGTANDEGSSRCSPAQLETFVRPERCRNRHLRQRQFSELCWQALTRPNGRGHRLSPLSGLMAGVCWAWWTSRCGSVQRRGPTVRWRTFTWS